MLLLLLCRSCSLELTLQLSTESMFIRMGKCKRAIAAKAPDKARPMRQYNATVRQRRVVMRRARREARRRRRTRRAARMVPQQRGLRARAPVCVRGGWVNGWVGGEREGGKG